LVQAVPQSETTPFYPRSPYGVAKLYAYWITVNYREAYNLFASNGILFNHESPRRGETFVTRKITRAISKIVLGLQDHFFMGNLDAKRDWGHAKDYVEAMWLILQQDTSEDFVIATGITTTVRDFIKMAFAKIGIQLRFEGEGIDEKGFIESVNKEVFSSMVKGIDHDSHIAKLQSQMVLQIDSRYFRPTEVELLIGDATKARQKLNWRPKYNLSALIEDMVKSDLEIMSKKLNLKNSGFQINNDFE